jgi:hypothetical protein
MEEPRIPNVYIIARMLNEAEQAYVHAALQITPCKCAIVANYDDLPVASMFCASGAICVESEPAALVIAAKLVNENIRPVLVIGSADVLDAIYDDGMRETLVAKCQTV